MSENDSKDPLFANKIMAAILVAGLIYAGLPILVNTFWGGGHHGGHHGEEHHDEENPLNLAYPIAFSLDAAAAEAEPEPDLGTLLAAASAARGDRGSAICRSCHTFEEGGANGTGPNLHGIIGRDIASSPGFAYSGALQELEGVWTYEKIDAYIANSSSYVPGTSMAQRIGKAEKRADILAYMQTQGSSEVPFPEPAPVIEEIEEMVSEGAEAVQEAVEDLTPGE